MDHAARVLVAEAAGFAVGAARIERKDRLEVRRLELGGHQLLGAKTRNADHADIAVAPRLRGDPLDQVVAVEGARAAALRFGDAARVGDDVDVAARDQKARVAGFRRSGPQHRPGRLQEASLGHLRALQILVVDRDRKQGRELLGGVGTVDVGADLHAIAHRDVHVLFGDHLVVGRRPIVVDRRPVARLRQPEGCIGFARHRSSLIASFSVSHEQRVSSPTL